jgi:hypothetical protein
LRFEEADEANELVAEGKAKRVGFGPELARR